MAFSGEFNSRTSFPDTFSLFLQGCGHPSKVSSSLAHISEKEMTGDLGEADRKGAGRGGIRWGSGSSSGQSYLLPVLYSLPEMLSSSEQLLRNPRDTMLLRSSNFVSVCVISMFQIPG